MIAFQLDGSVGAFQISVGASAPAGLLGLYHGVSIDRRSLNDAPRLGDVVYLYRLGLLSVARRRDGVLHEPRLCEEIRKTILHEIGHYHGMDEEELEDLGY